MHLLRTALRTLGTPWRILLKELSAFGTVGAINLGVQMGLFNWLHFGLRIGPLTSYLVSAIVATTSAYFMNRYWSFSHRARTGLAREYTLFFTLNAVATGIGLLILGLTRYGFHLTDKLSLNIANIIGIGLGTIFRFWSYKRWVFVAPAATTAGPDEQAARHASASDRDRTELAPSDLEPTDLPPADLQPAAPHESARGTLTQPIQQAG